MALTISELTIKPASTIPRSEFTHLLHAVTRGRVIMEFGYNRTRQLTPLEQEALEQALKAAAA